MKRIVFILGASLVVFFCYHLFVHFNNKNQNYYNDKNVFEFIHTNRMNFSTEKDEINKYIDNKKYLSPQERDSLKTRLLVGIGKMDLLIELLDIAIEQGEK
jgi:hypothetical protein